MKFIKLCCASAILLGLASSVWAEGCSKFNTSYDKTYCKGKLFIESDSELNDVYKNLTAKISSNTKRSLVQTQREWMSYRDNACETTPGTINVDCNYRVNKERTEYLRDRLRECTVGACNSEAVIGKSW